MEIIQVIGMPIVATITTIAINSCIAGTAIATYLISIVTKTHGIIITIASF